MNSAVKFFTITFCFYLIVPVTVSAQNLTPADSIKISEDWWDKGFEQYERGNYQEAYELFAKSNDYFGDRRSDKNPYYAMNHCLYKMGKTDQIDKKNAPYYYEELDTVTFSSPDMEAANRLVYQHDIDSAFWYFHRVLRADTLINRQNRKVHANRYGTMADACFYNGYIQHALNCYNKYYKIKEKLLPRDWQSNLDYIQQKLIECHLYLNQNDSALCVALDYAKRYKNGNETFFFIFYSQAETYLIRTYLRIGRFNEAYRELEFADSIYKSLEGKYYSPLYRLTRESEYYTAIGRPDKAYRIAMMADSIQRADTIFKNRDARPLAIAGSKIGNHKLGIAIMDSIVNSYNPIERDFVYPYELNDITMLADAYSLDGQFKKALEKYLLLDSIYCKFLRLNDGNRNYNNDYVSTLYKITKNAYNLRLDSLGDAYLDKLKDEVKFYKDLNGWEKEILMLEAQRAICHGKTHDALEYGELFIQACNGQVQEWVKDFMSYWYIMTNQADKAYEIESALVKDKKKAILNIFEELSDGERASLWKYNGDSFRNLLWSIFLKQDSTLWGQVYDDIALFSKGLLLTLSSNPDYKRVLGINWKEIRNSLKKKEMAIEFIAIPTGYLHPDSTIYAALYLKKEMDYPRIKYLCLGDDLRDLASRIKISNDYQDVYDYVWGGLEDEMKGISTVYFSADGYLHKIPIEYFIANQKNKKINAYRLTSTREIALKRKCRGFDNAVLYGNIDYSDYEKEYKPLPESQKEIDIIGQFLRKKNVTVNEYSHKEGTISTLLTYDRKPLSLLHLATHGLYYSKTDDYQNPLLMQETNLTKEDIAMSRSGLVLSDRIVTAEEISKLQFKNLQLVTLSACKSALGDITDGEGVFGLQRAFKQAGAQSILMTLWDVKDNAASEFMGYFYKRASKGDSLHKALKKAQKHMKEYDDGWGVNVYEEPEYWAGFVLLDAIGD